MASTYDLSGYLWPAGTNITSSYTFDWALPDTFPTGTSTTLWTNAMLKACNEWEKWANISFSDSAVAKDKAEIRLSYRPGEGNTAYALGYGSTYTFSDSSAKTSDYAEIVLGEKASAAAAWDARNLEWTLMHELGHILGLTDLYEFDGYEPEEFVDHSVSGNPLPDLRGDKDNVMDRYNGSGDDGDNDYSKAPTTIVDNDEIAGVTWLWGASRNQIVTGDLETKWTSINPDAFEYRKIEAHHGDQDNYGKGWWDYRGSIVSAAKGKKPYVDLEFPGYETFGGTLYSSPGLAGSATWTYAGNQGGNIERFQVDQAGWTGNFELFVKSKYTFEDRIKAWITGGRTDKFILPASDSGLVFHNDNEWAKVFGPTPIPEPSSWAFFCLGCIILLGLIQIRRRKDILQ